MDQTKLGPAVDGRTAGYHHRLAIAARFVERIVSSDAAFMTVAASEVDPPCTISGGERKPIGGFNRWMLLQVMLDQGWADPRFFTSRQAESAGWKIRPGARPVILQHTNPVDANGVVLHQPEVTQFAVFNAGEVEGAPLLQAATRTSERAVRAAMMAQEFEPGLDVITSLADWVEVLHAQRRNSVDEPLSRLVLAMATSTVAADVDFQGRGASGTTSPRVGRAAWVEVARAVQREPVLFFDAVREAEQLAAEIIGQLHLAELQLQGDRGGPPSAALLPPEAATGIQSVAKEEMAAMANAQARSRATESSDQPRRRSREQYDARLDEMFAEREAVLAVPIQEKDRAKDLGAVWYPKRIVWFVPKGMDVRKFKEWDPREHCLGQVAADREVIEAFRKDMEAMGLDAPMAIKADGHWHNVRVLAKKGKNGSGAYRLSLVDGRDGGPVGTINNKYSGEHRSWTFDGPLLTPEQKARMRAEAAHRAEAADREAQELQATAARHAAEIVARAAPARDHPYPRKKDIATDGLYELPGKVLLEYPEFIGENGKSAIRADQLYLIVPMRNSAGQIRAVQAISEDGAIKSFMRGAQKKGTMAVLGAPSLDAICMNAATLADPVVDIGFVEGFATGASFRGPTGMPVVVCFDAGNLETVAAEAAKKLPANARAVLAVDNDQFHVERALGYLAMHLGLNPLSQRGGRVQVACGGGKARSVSLGDAIADGDWHQAPKGRYCMRVEFEGDGAKVRSVAVETVDASGNKQRMNFSNRGVDAGRAALAAFSSVANGRSVRDIPLAVIAVPEFTHLEGRPTDWNDLAKAEGRKAVTLQVLNALRHPGHMQTPEPTRARAAERAPTGVGR